MTSAGINTESERLTDPQSAANWRRWGPYLSERQWGTVREDYSPDGEAWTSFPHDHARSRAYRWGEDGLAGFSDDRQQICLSLALWNGQDDILKERLFGLTNAQGNHGEDVKELYYFVDGLPSHAYMKMVYKYPQAAFPYDALIAGNASRGLTDPEFELIDTGIFAENRYFDVEIEYAKGDADDILMRIVAHNRGPDAAPLHILPQIWFRNTWSWAPGKPKPTLHEANGTVAVRHPQFAALCWQCEGAAPLLFCENETNSNRLYATHITGWFKDGINDAVVGGHGDCVNPAHSGTKAAAHVVAEIAAGASHEVRVRLSPAAAASGFGDFAEIFDARRQEADDFYAAKQTAIADGDARRVHRQALAGMLWNKQFYGYDIWRWLSGDPLLPAPPGQRWQGRNSDWRHFATGDVDEIEGGDILSMPDAWEYPWFAAWDTAFHSVVLATIDPGFAKSQLLLLTAARTLSPQWPDAGLRMEFRGCEPAGPRLGCAAGLRA